MRSQEEEAIYSKWLNEDVAHENAMIEEQMRMDQAMADAGNEAMIDAEITAFLSDNCASKDGKCDTEYYCTADGKWACKKCFTETPF